MLQFLPLPDLFHLLRVLFTSQQRFQVVFPMHTILVHHILAANSGSGLTTKQLV